MGDKSVERTAEVVAFEKAVVNYFVEAADILGIPKSVAAIYGICFASPEPLGFAEIQERLELSAGSVSQGLKVLKELGALKVAVQKAVTTGTESNPLSAQNVSASALRRTTARYEPDMQLRKLAARWMEERLKRQIIAGEHRLNALTQSLPPSLAVSQTTIVQRLNHLKGTHDKIRAALPFITHFVKG